MQKWSNLLFLRNVIIVRRGDKPPKDPIAYDTGVVCEVFRVQRKDGCRALCPSGVSEGEPDGWAGGPSGDRRLDESV